MSTTNHPPPPTIPAPVMCSNGALVRILINHIDSADGCDVPERIVLRTVAPDMLCPDIIAALLTCSGPQLQAVAKVVKVGLQVARTMSGPREALDVVDALAPIYQQLPALDPANLKSPRIPPSMNSTERDHAWAAKIWERDRRCCIITQCDSDTTACHIIPNCVFSAERSAPFWGMALILLGEKTLCELRRQIYNDESAKQCIQNGFLLDAGLHKPWNEGRIRLDWYASGEKHIDMRMYVSYGTVNWSKRKTELPKHPDLPTPEPPVSRDIATGDVYRISTDDTTTSPVPTRFLVDVRSMFGKMWTLLGMVPENRPAKRRKGGQGSGNEHNAQGAKRKRSPSDGQEDEREDGMDTHKRSEKNRDVPKKQTKTTASKDTGKQADNVWREAAVTPTTPTPSENPTNQPANAHADEYTQDSENDEYEFKPLFWRTPLCPDDAPKSGDDEVDEEALREYEEYRAGRPLFWTRNVGQEGNDDSYDEETENEEQEGKGDEDVGPQTARRNAPESEAESSRRTWSGTEPYSDPDDA